MSNPRSSIRTVGITKEESRLKREAQTLSLRKKARDQLLSKRRRGNAEGTTISNTIFEDKNVLESVSIFF